MAEDMQERKTGRERGRKDEEKPVFTSFLETCCGQNGIRPVMKPELSKYPLSQQHCIGVASAGRKRDGHGLPMGREILNL